MEDILEKLKLLDYDIYFCKPLNWSPLSKIYFATCDPDNKEEQFFYFFELSYWIMRHSNKKKGKIAPTPRDPVKIEKMAG